MCDWPERITTQGLQPYTAPELVALGNLLNVVGMFCSSGGDTNGGYAHYSLGAPASTTDHGGGDGDGGDGDDGEEQDCD